MGALGKSYDLAVSQKELLKSSSIEEKLKMTTNNCQKTLEEYNKIVKNEEQAENRYYYDKDNNKTYSSNLYNFVSILKNSSNNVR